MKVLHIWDIAGVASLLARYQAKLLRWKTWVIMRKQFDPYGLTNYGEICECSKLFFYKKVLKLVRDYDIIHIHSLDKVIPLIKFLYPSKIVVVHYHGSDIRGKWLRRRKYWRFADLVLVSTPDLLEGAPRHVIYLPNPVDTELFRPIPRLRRPNTALYFYDPLNPALSRDVEWAKKIASELGVELTIHDRRRKPIPHKRLPLFLNRFEYFIDRRSIPSLSKTGLEALACGLKVIKWDGRIVEGLPKEHRPENVIRKLAYLYKRAYLNRLK